MCPLAFVDRASGRDTSHWGENYTYDNWGNLYQTAAMTGLAGNNWTVTVNANNQLSNLGYDAAGEVTADQYGNSYTYNAEGRILTGGGGAYVYDGDGNRVEKTVGGTTTLYWPGAGSLLDESNSSGSAMGTQVWFAGLLIWHEDTSGSGLFLFHDHLGSIRVTGDAGGNLRDDNDYRSYGMLSGNYGASPSGNHYLFTGDESDTETSSDYAVNRNLGMPLGRFNRPDPYDGSYDPTNPQSLNRYAYVLDNPLAYVDPFGLAPECEWIWYSNWVNVTVPGPHGDGSHQEQQDHGHWGVVCSGGDGGGQGSASGARSGGGGGGRNAPNNGTQNPRSTLCKIKVGAGIGLDVAGTAAGLVPGASAALVTTQVSLGLASSAYSAYNGNAAFTVSNATSAQLSAVAAGAEYVGWKAAAESIPYVATGANLIALGWDVWHANSDYQACLAGH